MSDKMSKKHKNTQFHSSLVSGPEFWPAESAGVPVRSSDPQGENRDIASRLIRGQEDRGQD